MLHRRLALSGLGLGLACLVAGACGSKGAASGGDGGASASNGASGAAPATTGSASNGSAGTGGAESTSSGNPASGSTSGSSSSSGSTSSGGPAPTCATTVTAVDVSAPDTVVGTGTAASCTEAAVTAAVAAGGKITFKCGSAAAVVTITKTLALRTDKDTTLDGGNLVTLDGGSAVQMFNFAGPDFQKTKTTVTFQHIAFTNAKATGSMPFPTASPPCSQGFQDGGGGVI
jgi:hypothetical protein